MAGTLQGPDAQDALFHENCQTGDVSPALARAAARLQFSPSYVVVGAYRLFTDKALYVPAWEKCKHAIQRGAMVGLTWSLLTFKIQRKFIKLFMMNSKRVIGLSEDTVFGYKVPFSLPTYVAVFFIGSQVTVILKYFLARNIKIARERAWAQTVESRGKGPEFWQPYVEEWDTPPQVDERPLGMFRRLTSSWVGQIFLRRVLLSSLSLYPIVGVAVSACFKGLGTARYLHTPYFEAKGMTPRQRLVFIEERKWDYRAFGFVAALLEGLPIIGLVFTISNRVGAAMWAHDLEKRQHFVAARQLKRRS